MGEIKLKPCPFCGGEFDLSNNGVKQGDKWLWSAECLNCGCFMDDKDKDNLIKRVNTRKPMERIVERLEELDDLTLDQFNRSMAGTYEHDFADGKSCGLELAIEIVEEEGGIE